MDVPLFAGSRGSSRPPDDTTECGGAGQPAAEVWRNHSFHGSSASDRGWRCRVEAYPPTPSFRYEVIVGKTQNDSVLNLTATGAAAMSTEPEECLRIQQQPWQQLEQREPPERQQNLQQQMQSLSQQQEQEDGADDQPEPQSRAQAVEELQRSVSGLRRLSSLTQMSTGEFHTWKRFLLPTASAALSVPMLIAVGCAPILCMILFISCLHNLLAAMFMMHWVCMVAVPLLYVKLVERSFDYYTHVWSVQSCRFAAQWKRALLLGCGAAVGVFCMYRLLRYWGGAWFASLVDNARSRALAAGLDLSFGPLLVVAWYFCICNPIIEEWFWRIFLYREFGGAVFFAAEDGRGILLLRQASHLPRLRNGSINNNDPAQLSAAPVDHRGSSPGQCAFGKAGRSGSFTAGTDKYSYRELHYEREVVASAGTADSPPARTAAKRDSSAFTPTTPTAPCSGVSAAPFGIAHDTTSGGFGAPDSAVASASADQAAAGAAAQDVAAPGYDSPTVKATSAAVSRLLPSSSISVQPTARADPLLIDAPHDAEAPAYAAPDASGSPPGPRVAAVGRATGLPSSSVVYRDSSSSPTASSPPSSSRVSCTWEGALQLLPAKSADFEGREAPSLIGEDGVTARPSLAAPDAPIVTRVGEGILQVDLRLSFVGQVVLSLFYASYHTVVVGFLAGVLGGCLALPCVAVLGMIFILLRNSCTFGLLGGVIVHGGVDIGVAVVFGAILQYYT